MHGLDIEYRSPSGVQVDLSFMGGEGLAVFDSGTVASFATFNGYRPKRVSSTDVVEVCNQLVDEGSLVRLEDSTCALAVLCDSCKVVPHSDRWSGG